ncbi:MAG: NADH-quinone oxidoreductase subunit J, partial [Terriglobales bacterium]
QDAAAVSATALNALIDLSGAIAVIATVLVITRSNAVHALLYLIVSLLAVAVVFYALGAPFAAALEVIIYAGAIMVLFVFVTMMLNLGEAATRQERAWQPGRAWVGPSVLGALVLAVFFWTLLRGAPPPTGVHMVGPRAVGLSLMSTYILGVELASMLLMGGVIAAYHIGSSVGRRQAYTAEAEKDRTAVR